MGNLMMRWNRKASGSRLLETETPKYSRCLPVTPAAFAVFTACESAAIREPASAGRPLAAAGGGTMGIGF